MRLRSSVVALCVGAVVSVGAVLSVGLAGIVSAHVVQQFGPYSVAIGWLHEPAYVGVENAVQVIVKDAAGKSVNDVAASDFTVTVSAGGHDSAALPLNASFDPDTGLGVPGEYTAHLIPTVPGDYTFHIVGTIHGTTLDQSFPSSDTTFDAVDDRLISRQAVKRDRPPENARPAWALPMARRRDGYVESSRQWPETVEVHGVQGLLSEHQGPRLRQARARKSRI